ncbi:MAG: beta-hydroxylase [Planctomycetia bacterium]|nr:beta-hydroxylase [Planctomycetia bacterium]
MATYLESLTLRLAEGLAAMPEEYRQRQAKFLLAKQNADGGFSGREGASDLYYTSFALRGLAVLGELHGEPAAAAGRFLAGRLAGQETVVDFFSLLYGAFLLEQAAGVSLFGAAPSEWRQRVGAVLEGFRRGDGGYAASHEGGHGSTYYTFLVLLCQQLMQVETPQPQRIVEFLRGRLRDDGGFVELAPMKRSGTNPTAAAVATLRMLGAVTDDVRSRVVDFLVDRQTDEGGLAANTRIPIADVLSTFTGVLTLHDLGALGELDADAARGYLRSVEAPQGGYFGAVIDTAADVEYTFYGLGATAILAQPAKVA